MTMLMLKRLNVPLDRDVIFLAEAGEEGSTGVGIGFMVAGALSRRSSAEYCFAEGGNVTRVGGKVKFAAIADAGEDVARHRADRDGTIGPRIGAAAGQRHRAPVARRSRRSATWRVPIRLNDTTRAFFTRMALVVDGGGSRRGIAPCSTPDSPAAAAADASFTEREPRYASMLRTSISPTIINGGYPRRT